MMAVQMLPWLRPDAWDEAWKRGVYGGWQASIMTILLTLFLELCSMPTVRQVLKQPGGQRLYRTALFYNLRNHILLGIPTYAIAVAYVCLDKVERPLWQMTMHILVLIILHDLMYYQAHKTFHTTAGWYQYHKFHHQFHFHTPPSTANAVTSVEYLVAYVLPFALAAALVRPTESELRIAVSIISVFNLLEHTPRLDGLTWPQWLVSPQQHLEHHRKGTVHYAAPVFNIDWFHECWRGKM